MYTSIQCSFYDVVKNLFYDLRAVSNKCKQAELFPLKSNTLSNYFYLKKLFNLALLEIK